MIRTIQHDEALDTVWSELVYSEARLLQAKEAEDLAAEMAALLKRWSKVQSGQFDVWRGEIIAQASVDACNDDLDDTTDDIADGLLGVTGKDRTAPRFRRYFAKPPNEVIRLGLESQISLMKEWPQSLKTEPEKQLQALGAKLDKDVAAGSKAVEERRAAVARTADHRVREIVRFIDDVNAVRQSVYGILVQRAAAQGLGRDWPHRFFRRGTSTPRARKPAGDGTGTPAPPQ